MLCSWQYLRRENQYAYGVGIHSYIVGKLQHIGPVVFTWADIRKVFSDVLRPTLQLLLRVRQRSGTKSDQNLAKGHVLFQKRLGTAAMPIKGGTQEAKFQRLLSLELQATQKRLERPEGEEGQELAQGMPADGV